MTTATITSAKGRYFVNVLQQKYQVFYVRRFTSATCGEVTHQYYREIKLYRFKYLFIVQIISEGCY